MVVWRTFLCLFLLLGFRGAGVVGAPVVGLDLSGSSSRPTGWALLRGLWVEARHLYGDDEILGFTSACKPALVAIDAPLNLPGEGAMREADRLMHRLGYPVLPPGFPGMRELTTRATKLAGELQRRGLRVIEVHPASTRKALNMPVKDWAEIQRVYLSMGLRGDVESRRLSRHELDAVAAALTARLHTLGLTRLVGRGGACIVLPVERDWRWLVGRIG